MFEEKEKRYRLVCLERVKDLIIANVGKYEFLHIVGQYDKKSKGNYNDITWTNIIIDSDKELHDDFVSKFNKEVNEELGTFEIYEKYFD